MRAYIILALALGILASNVHACKRITAAINIGGKAYLFFGNKYVSLTDDGGQGYTGSTYDDWGFDWPDAAVVWSIDKRDYYFSDKYFFGAWNGYTVPADSKYFIRGTNFFDNGLDAAGNVNGTSFFIKGCNFVMTLPTHLSNPEHLPEGIPCDLDAALTVGTDMWLFKDNQMWKVSTQGVEDGMPVDTSSEIVFDDITLCAQGEKEE